METKIKTQIELIDKLRTEARRLRKGWEISFCPKQKGRIAWDEYKLQIQIRCEQRHLVKICDLAVESIQLESFLKSQNLTISR